MWNAIGAALGLLMCVLAVVASRRSNEHAAVTYGMAPATHRGYALGFALLAAALAASFVVQQIPVYVLLAVLIGGAVFYAASFAQGYSDTE